jgi:hypothetical protein
MKNIWSSQFKPFKRIFKIDKYPEVETAIACYSLEEPTING